MQRMISHGRSNQFHYSAKKDGHNFHDVISYTEEAIFKFLTLKSILLNSHFTLRALFIYKISFTSFATNDVIANNI